MAEGNLRVVVTGAGGWLGLATLEMLLGLFGADFDRRVACFGSNARALTLRGGMRIAQRPLSEIGEIQRAPSLVLHLAYLTQEKAVGMSSETYAAANRAISQQVLEALDPIGAQGVFLASSGAAWRTDDPTAPASVRLYGALKVEDEDRFTAWAEEAGAAAVIARVFNLAGPYINKRSSYVLACLIADALADRPFAIRSAKPVYRSYVAISELMSVVFGALTRPSPGVVRFDTAGEGVYEASEIADAVAVALNRPRGAQRPPQSEEIEDRYVGDGVTYAALCRDFGVERVTFSEQIRQTARFMAECT
ncbi:MAG TPA: NAD(P)-dependent oxidoreductase [Caulobacteraceae bacterium]